MQAYANLKPVAHGLKVRIDGDRVEMRTHHQWVRLGCLSNCNHGCSGGWPGTLMSGRALLDAALAGNLRPESLGCETIREQGEMLVKEINHN